MGVGRTALAAIARSAMDIVSHGLWGGIAFGRKSRASFWRSFVIGAMPDLLAFGPFFAATFLGFAERPHFSSEPPDPALIPAYVHNVYQVTNSIVIFAAVFLAVWLVWRKPFWELCAWGLHILLDIPTHSYQFFPTPFLWPLSSFEVNGRSWGNPEIFFPNVALLLALYVWYFVWKRRRRATGTHE